MAALDAGEYEKALIDFTEARALLGDKANVSELLRVTEDLRSKRDRAAASRPTHVAAAPSPPPPRPVSRPSMARRMAMRETPIPAVETTPLPPPPPPASGLLIVSTTPRGLLVHVDEAAIDLTPMRTKVKPGSHRVALFDGDRKVYEATVDVKDGGTATLVKDLPVEMAVEMAPPREAPPPPPAPPAPRAEPPRTIAARLPARGPAVASFGGAACLVSRGDPDRCRSRRLGFTASCGSTDVRAGIRRSRWMTLPGRRRSRSASTASRSGPRPSRSRPAAV